MIEILEKATVTYIDGLEEQFDAIRMTDKGVVIGRILDGELLEYGFIPKQAVKKIKGGTRRTF